VNTDSASTAEPRMCYLEPRRVFWLRHYLNRLLPRLKTQGHVPDRPRLCAFPNDLIGREMAVAGRFEMSGLRAVDYLCDRGVIQAGEDATLLDVGANIGTYAVCLHSRFGRVHAFEPHPIVAKVLDINLEVNQIRNVRVHRVALSNREGTATLQDAGVDNVGASTLERERLPEALRGSQSHEVPVVRGDQHLAAAFDERVAFVKIDVEGHEEEAIEGLSGLLSRHMPVIGFEANSAEASERLWRRLTSLGYTRFWALDFFPRYRHLAVRVLMLSLFGVRHALSPLDALRGRSYSLVFAMTDAQDETLRNSSRTAGVTVP
jgi:FkbM family methyltransferase